MDRPSLELSHLFKTDIPLDVFGIPEIVDIEPTHNCNFRCIQCHVPYESLTMASLDAEALRRSVVGFEGKWATVGATHEPAMHPKFPELISVLTDAGMKIDLTTNGSFFTDKLISQIKHGNFASITVSFDGARKETYERIRHLANYQRTLDRVMTFKNAIGNEKTRWTSNYTVLKSNIEEIHEAVQLWDHNNFDLITFISMVVRNKDESLLREALDESTDDLRCTVLKAARDVIASRRRISLASPCILGSGLEAEYPNNVRGNFVFSNHSGVIRMDNVRPHFMLGQFPGVPIPCRAPYKHVRITYHGDIQLCYKFPIGNINQTSLIDAWNGEEANRVRKMINDDVDICNSCEFYRFCIRADSVDPSDDSNWRSGNAK